MTRHRFAAAIAAVLFAVIFLGLAGSALAAQQRVAQAGKGTIHVLKARDAEQAPAGGPESAAETRKQWYALLRQAPPALGRVLKLDPTLLGNPTYLAPYPALGAFVAAHPEIARDPRYFFEEIYLGYEDRPPDPKQEEIRMWRSLVDGFTMFLVFLVITGAIIWLIRTLIEHRRWLRSSKMQLELHTRLFDRFTNSEELLAYVQSPAGRRFFDTAPAVLDPAPRDVGMPVRRILWAAQVGLVLAAGGCGLLIVAGRAIEQMRQPLSGLGVVIVFLGLGFIVSAVASFVLARRMGVLAERRPPAAGA